MAGVVLVEGRSDAAAVQAVARRRGRDLGAEGVTVVAMGGATNLGHHLGRYPGVRLAGLCDAAEEPYFRRCLERAGRTAGSRAELAALGFFVCEADLEDELIRALGVEAVLAVVAAQGELRSYERFARQPAQRDRPAAVLLHRFLGTISGRKIRYGGLLADAVPADRVPAVLDRVLDAVG